VVFFAFGQKKERAYYAVLANFWQILVPSSKAIKKKKWISYGILLQGGGS
jgi:hypothetical protein